MTIINHFVKEVVFQEAVTIAGLLTEAGTTLTAGIGIVWQICTANPLLSLFVGAAVLSLGFKFFRKGKKAAG